MSQSELNIPKPGGARELRDLLEVLPHGVMPTRFYVLQQGDDLLFIKPLPYGTKDLFKSLKRIIGIVIRHGNNVEAPGSTAVMCFQPVQVTTRLVRWFDHTGEAEPVEEHASDMSGRVYDWFMDRKSRR
jgi:hypothetical protein